MNTDIKKIFILSEKSVGNVDRYMKRLKDCNPELIISITYSRTTNEYPNYKFYLKLNQKYINRQKLNNITSPKINLLLNLNGLEVVVKFIISSLHDYGSEMDESTY